MLRLLKAITGRLVVLQIPDKVSGMRRLQKKKRKKKKKKEKECEYSSATG